MTSLTTKDIISPPVRQEQSFTDATKAVEYLQKLYFEATEFLTDHLRRTIDGDPPPSRVRAFYPEVRIRTNSFTRSDSRLAFGFVSGPGHYATTITRPDLFEAYLQDQISLLLSNHNQPVSIATSNTQIPVHFAIPENMSLPSNVDAEANTPQLRDIFDVPELDVINDDIVNDVAKPTDILPLAPFTAQRIDYSLARLNHYTATSPRHFQKFILFTNYQFYVSEFISFAEKMLADEKSGYESFVAPGNLVTKHGSIKQGEKLPQMPAYHLTRADGTGITLVNIGVGPSNAKTATDHMAVLRPSAWLMVGHCAGLRNSQTLGDYVLAHAYVREDQVLDADLPISVPVPALAEVQIALEQSVAEISTLAGYDLKRIMRTGTVATVDNRNWELRDQSGPIHRLSQSRAIALDMESATIAANGFRFRVPYGTLLCVSDKPLHGELKLPGLATSFYKTQVAKHLQIGIRACEKLREMPIERLHSRKLRSFDETAFL